MKYEEIRKNLEESSDEKYGLFHSKLVPGVSRIMGVRVPEVRKIAKKAAADWEEYLEEAEKKTASECYQEELMVHGMTIGYAKMDRDERIRHLDRFVPRINSWAVCDTCVNTYKFMEKEPDYWYEYLMKYRESREEYEVRFLLTALLSHFVNEDYIDRVLGVSSGIRHEGYYVRMANAWLVQVCYVKYPEKTRHFLEKSTLDDFTHNKAIQKIRESYRVSREEKEELKLLKR